jgi:hypothetical protein
VLVKTIIVGRVIELLLLSYGKLISSNYVAVLGHHIYSSVVSVALFPWWLCGMARGSAITEWNTC